MPSKFMMALAGVSLAGLSLAACGHDDKTYIIETERDAAVVAPERDVAVRANIELAHEQVQIVRQYYVERDCPPGYVRSDAGCLAPSVVTERRYVIGQPLPRDVVAVDLPQDLIVRLQPLPRGYVYRIVDGDLVIVEESNLVVLDADDLY